MVQSRCEEDSHQGQKRDLNSIEEEEMVATVRAGPGDEASATVEQHRHKKVKLSGEGKKLKVRLH